MRTVKIRCQGETPLLMDPMGDDILEELRTGVRAQKSKDVPAVDVASKKIYREFGETGQIGLPSDMLFSCLKGAGRNVKNGKKQISTAKTTTMPDFMAIQELFLPLIGIDAKDEQKHWKVDKRRGRLKDGTAICVVRPRFEKWEFEVVIEYDETKISDSVLKALFNSAGSTQGLGSFRPNCGGPFGRFKVIEWTDEGAKKKAA